MNLETIIDISSATLGLFSSVFFCVGVLHIKDSTLNTIGTSMWESKPALANELALQKVDFIFGAFLLFLSFFVQILVKCLSSTLALSVVTTSALSGVAVGLIGPVALLVLLFLFWRAGRVKALKKLKELQQ